MLHRHDRNGQVEKLELSRKEREQLPPQVHTMQVCLHAAIAKRDIPLQFHTTPLEQNKKSI